MRDSLGRPRWIYWGARALVAALLVGAGFSLANAPTFAGMVGPALTWFAGMGAPTLDWLAKFATSPGFGGLAAVIAALVAYRAARRTADAARSSATSQQWWETARWAADKLLMSSQGGGDALEDADAAPAIVTLQYLGRTAPSAEMSDFTLKVLLGAMEVEDDGSAPASGEGGLSRGGAEDDPQR